MPPMMSPTKTAILLAPLILTFLFGCQSAVNGTSEIAAKIDQVYPVLAIETGRLPATGISNFARERMAGMIGTRLRESPHNPFVLIRGSGRVPDRDTEHSNTANPGEPSPGPTLVARLTFIHYDHFGDAWAAEFDPFYRIKIVGVLDLIDSETQEILLSRRLVRVLRLRGFDDLSGFNRSRSPLLGRRRVHIHGFGDESSKIRLLEHAFASAVVREIFAHVPSPPNAY
ncbi:MAG: hypothetical protein HQ511_09410 [Rhodospirillales bacterium]|nr:hypothetical protein [Rhodospirillales bacterium]